MEFCLRNGLTRPPRAGDEADEVSARAILELAAGPGDAQTIAAHAEWNRERTAS